MMVECSVHLWVTVTLTSDLVLGTIVSGAYPLYCLSAESQIRCVDASWDGKCGVQFSGHCDLDL